MSTRRKPLRTSHMDPYEAIFAKVENNRKIDGQDYVTLLARMLFGSSIKSPVLADKVVRYTLLDCHSELLRLKHQDYLISVGKQPSADKTGLDHAICKLPAHLAEFEKVGHK